MKGTLGIGAVLVLLNVLLFAITSNAVAPPRPAPPAPRSTRVAVFNLTAVVKSYRKFERFQAQLKAAVNPFQERDTKLKKKGEALATEAATASEERKAEIEDILKGVTREIEDNKAKASRVLGKRQAEQLQELYGDIEKAARRLARDKGYDLVLHYNDANTEEDLRSEANISRKMQAGALIPMHVGAGLDVGREILADLNDRLGVLEARGPAERDGAVEAP